MTRPKTAAQRARLVAQWRASLLSQAAFARQHHVHPRTFWDWIRQAPVAAPARPAPRFVPVQVLDAPRERAGGEGVTIVLPGGERIQVSVGTSPTWVAAVVAELRPRC
jgi:transposase-like protein